MADLKNLFYINFFSPIKYFAPNKNNFKTLTNKYKVNSDDF